MSNTAEQQARDLLERLDIEDAQSFSSGDLVELANLIAEVNHWRSVAEAIVGEQTPEALERWAALSGLSINLHGGYGEWGCETLECLFAELGIQPGDDFEQAIEHARGGFDPIGGATT